MSGPRLSIIPARAATDPTLKPRDLQVLCVLGRHTDDLGWCRRSQVKMAAEMQCARSTVYGAIERLIKAGYLERYVQEEDNGRDSPHLYRVVLDPVHADVSSVADADTDAEAEEDAAPPAGISAPPAAISAPPAGPGPAPKNDSFRTIEREARARDLPDGDENGSEPEPDYQPEGSSKRAEALFFRSFTGWDRFAVSPKKPMLAAWGKLSWADMQAAADAVPRYLAACRAAGQRHAPAIATYLDLRERLWDAHPPDERREPEFREAAPFGKAWMAARLEKLIAGPEPGAHVPGLTAFERSLVADGKADEAALIAEKRMRHGFPSIARLDEAAAFGRGRTVEARLGPLSENFEKVRVGSELWEAWKAEHDRRGWPWLPDTGRHEWVYFPPGGPDGLKEFEDALHGQGEAERKDAAE